MRVFVARSTFTCMRKEAAKIAQIIAVKEYKISIIASFGGRGVLLLYVVSSVEQSLKLLFEVSGLHRASVVVPHR